MHPGQVMVDSDNHKEFFFCGIVREGYGFTEGGLGQMVPGISVGKEFGVKSPMGPSADVGVGDVETMSFLRTLTNNPYRL